jgi:putative ribose/galactose/methyl galactoside import ATP-binding protein
VLDMEQEMILKLQNIRKNFGGIQALKDVSLSLKKGEVHALLGENGAGKSTLIKILTGVHKADSGEILLHGQEITVQNPIDARKKGLQLFIKN